MSQGLARSGLASLPRALSTPRLRLRWLDAGDGAALHDAIAHVEPGAEIERSHSVADSAALVRLYRAHLRLGARAVYGIFSGDDDATLLGTVQLAPSVFSATAIVLSYWLDSRHRKKGYATEAAGALTAFAFTALELTRVELYCDVANRDSAAIARKLGFVLEGTLPRWLRVGEHERDMMVWALPREQLSPSLLAQVTIDKNERLLDENDKRAALWNELVEPLVARHKIRARHVGLVVIELRVSAADQHYLQELSLELGTKADGAPWLLVKALIGGESLMDARLGLRHNAALAVGAITIENGALLLRASLDPDSLDVERLAPMVQLVAEEAARLRVICMRAQSVAEADVAAAALQTWWTK